MTTKQGLSTADAVGEVEEIEQCWTEIWHLPRGALGYLKLTVLDTTTTGKLFILWPNELRDQERGPEVKISENEETNEPPTTVNLSSQHQHLRRWR